MPEGKAKARADARPTGRKIEWPKGLVERVKAGKTALHAVGVGTAATTPARGGNPGTGQGGDFGKGLNGNGVFAKRTHLEG